MGAYLKQAQLSLEAYLGRGRRAIAQLQEEEWEEALLTLRWREAAFQNFKVADAQEMKSGNDLRNDSVVTGMIAEVATQNSLLEKSMLSAVSVTRKREIQVVKERALVGKFHSGQKEESQISQSV